MGRTPGCQGDHGCAGEAGAGWAGASQGRPLTLETPELGLDHSPAVNAMRAYCECAVWRLLEPKAKDSYCLTLISLGPSHPLLSQK